MSTGEVRVFSCEPNAKGTSLKIQIKGRHEYLTLCEVFIFGRGKIEVKCYFAMTEENTPIKYSLHD